MKPELVTASDREKTKRVVYAVIYGVGEYCHSDHSGTLPGESSVCCAHME